jgi:hypothetical protein
MFAYIKRVINPLSTDHIPPLEALHNPRCIPCILPAAARPRRFAERIDIAKCGSPALLGVIVATGYGYRREDGVAVIPIGALGS